MSSFLALGADAIETEHRNNNLTKEDQEMKLARLTTSTLFGLLALGLVTIMVSCSGSDSNNPMGPDGAAKVTYDDISVSLNSVNVKYDCDYDPAGVNQPGDFHYYLNVDTLNADGKWVAASNNKSEFAAINNGGSKAPSNEKASFKLRREDGQKFRVRVGIREADTGGDDFNDVLTVTHIYNGSSGQLYPPESGKYSTYNSTTDYGTMTLSINKRDRKWVLGVLTGEGCQLSMTYSVRVTSTN